MLVLIERSAVKFSKMFSVDELSALDHLLVHVLDVYVNCWVE